MSNAETPSAAGAPSLGTAPAGSATGTDWTVEAADAIEKAVVAVRRQTVDRAQGISKAVVYGLLALGFALPAVTLLIIGLFRMVVAAYDQVGVGSWAAWLTLGGIWLLGGMLAWAKRNPAAH